MIVYIVYISNRREVNADSKMFTFEKKTRANDRAWRAYKVTLINKLKAVMMNSEEES